MDRYYCICLQNNFSPLTDEFFRLSTIIFIRKVLTFKRKFSILHIRNFQIQIIMKTAKLVLCLLIAFNFIDIKEAQGQEPASGVKDNRLTGGNVGIGTTNPVEKFHLEGGNFLHRSVNPFIFLDNTNAAGTTGLAFQYTGNWKGWLYYNEAEDHLMINADAGAGYRPDIVIKSDGKVGIGNSTPSGKLHVVESLPGYTGIFGTNIAPWTVGHNLSVGNTGEDAAFYVGQGGGYTGYLWWDYNETPANGSFRIGTYNGLNPMYLQPYGGSIRVGYPDAVPASLFEVYYNANNKAQLGYNNALGNYFYHSESPDNGDGQAGIYGYRTRSAQNDGTSYSLTTSNSAIKGYNYWGDYYSFGTSGFNDNDNNRCGGVLGAQTSGAYWGALGYKGSDNSYYGGYFCAYGTGIGGGKGPLPEYVGIGIGAWGELLGADIHGKLYGSYIEGKNYALFTNGAVYKNDVDVHLQNNGSGESIVLYTNVSTDVTVQTCGTVMLASGRASVSFDPSFKAAVSPIEPVVVTLTPVGNSNGVYLSEVSTDGFKVVENNEGRSNVAVNYIAIGKRAGYENPGLPPELIDGTYVDKMNRGLHDDGNTQTDGEGIYYENGQLIVGIHPSTLPDPNKPPEPVQQPPSVSPIEQHTAGYNKATKIND
jgi:hypothetical protein